MDALPPVAAGLPEIAFRRLLISCQRLIGAHSDQAAEPSSSFDIQAAKLKHVRVLGGALRCHARLPMLPAHASHPASPLLAHAGRLLLYYPMPFVSSLVSPYCLPVALPYPPHRPSAQFPRYPSMLLCPSPSSMQYVNTLQEQLSDLERSHAIECVTGKGDSPLDALNLCSHRPAPLFFLLLPVPLGYHWAAGGELGLPSGHPFLPPSLLPRGIPRRFRLHPLSHLHDSFFVRQHTPSACLSIPRPLPYFPFPAPLPVSSHCCPSLPPLPQTGLQHLVCLQAAGGCPRRALTDRHTASVLPEAQAGSSSATGQGCPTTNGSPTHVHARVGRWEGEAGEGGR